MKTLFGRGPTLTTVQCYIYKSVGDLNPGPKNYVNFMLMFNNIKRDKSHSVIKRVTMSEKSAAALMPKSV